MSLIHGKTKIELYNANTNVKEIIRSENTFQSDVLAHRLRNLGAANVSSLDNSVVRSDYLWKEIVGGIFLFKDPIPVGDHYMRAGNKMTGNGSYGISNSDVPVELGSYNVQESSANYRAITQVYDFTTNQSNGLISSVCLTSKTGGLMGYGNYSGQKYWSGNSNTMPYIYRNEDISTVNPLEAQDSARRAILGNYAYKITYDSTNYKIQLQRARVPITQASVFDWIPETLEDIDVSNLDYNNVTYNGINIPNYGNGKIYICNGGQNIAPNTTFKYWVLDVDTLTITEKTFTNTSSNTISSYYVSFSNGYAFFRGPNIDNLAYMSVFDESTNVHLGDFAFSDNIYTSTDYQRTGPLPNGLSILGGSWSQPNYGGIGYAHIYDPVNNAMPITNGSLEGGNTRYSGTIYDSELDALTWCGRYEYRVCNNPLYLATINNLSSPVTKTSAQTMKVTYSLEEAEE